MTDTRVTAHDGAVWRAPRIVRRALRRLNMLAGGVDWRRFVLREKVLRAALATRAQVARHRATLQPAVDREQAFVRISESYREASECAAREDGRFRRVAVDGIPWFVPLLKPDDPAAVSRVIGQQDFPYRAIIQTRELGLGGTMLDIGANVGRMSIPRLILGDAQLVYCAEPEPLNYECLVRNVHVNGLRGLVMPDRVAIGSENGTVRMMRAKSPGGHRIVGAQETATGETVDVRVRTLDSWCDEIGVDVQQVTFVKVDAQGCELHLLRGASRLLACRHIAWQLEIDETLLRTQGDTTGALFTMLQRHFTHFIDLNKMARGARIRPVTALAEALGYIGAGAHTDVLVFTMAASEQAVTP